MTIALDDVPAVYQPAVAQVKHLLGCYLRYFVGRPRAGADLLHFHEIVNRFDAHVKRVADNPMLRDALTMRLDLLRIELKECEAVLAGPMSTPDRVGYLAARANQQFQLYNRHFSSRARLSRRPQLSARLVANLKTILTEMRTIDLAELPNTADHVKNIDMVTKELERQQGEEAAILEERETKIREELVRQLGADANAEFIEYRKKFENKDRQTVDLEILAGICDRLGEIAYQMGAIAEETDDSINLANLRLVTRNLAAYEGEFVQVAELRKKFVSIAGLVTSEQSLRAQLAVADATDEERKQALERLDALLADPLVKRVATAPTTN